MKKFKNNAWNRIFHGEEVIANSQLMKDSKSLISQAHSLISRIGEVYESGNPKITGATSLLDVLALHKEAWKSGFKSENLGPCSYGIFRTESIDSMKPEEVFLGNIYGLFTKSIPFWEKYKNEGKSAGGYPIYEHLTVYEIILHQYKRHLSANILAIRDKAEADVAKLKSLGY